MCFEMIYNFECYSMVPRYLFVERIARGHYCAEYGRPN